MQIETSGGSKDTDVNELAAMPTSSPSTRAATATTPLGKLAKALSRIFLSVTGWITITRSTLLRFATTRDYRVA